MAKVAHLMLRKEICVGFSSFSWLLCNVSGLIKLATMMVSLKELFLQDSCGGRRTAARSAAIRIPGCGPWRVITHSTCGLIVDLSHKVKSVKI